jgi:hypothetical protein
MFGLSDEEMIRMQREMYTDKQFDALLEATAESAQAAATAGGLGGGSDLGGGGLGGGGLDDPLGGTGGDLPGAGLDSPAGGLGPDATPTPPAGDAPAAPGAPAAGGAPAPSPEDQGSLLAEPPGKRDEPPVRYIDEDGNTTTLKSKGKKYKPESVDSRKGAGSRNNNRRSMRGENSVLANKDNIFKGYRGLSRVATGIMQESVIQGEYSKEEERIFQTSFEVSKIIDSLKSRDKNEA